MFSDKSVWIVICELPCPYPCRLGVPAGHVRRVTSGRHRDAQPRAWPWGPSTFDIAHTPWWVEFKQVEGMYPVLAVHPPREFAREQVFTVPPLLLGWAQRLGFKGFALDGQNVIPLWEPNPNLEPHPHGILAKEAKEQ